MMKILIGSINSRNSRKGVWDRLATYPLMRQANKYREDKVVNMAKMKFDNFDEIFNFAIKKTDGLTVFQTETELYAIYQDYKSEIPYDMDTFFSLVHHKDKKLKYDKSVKRLMLGSEEITEKYNRGCLYGTSVEGVHYYNYFKRDNEGYWHCSYYEEADKTIKEELIEVLLQTARDRLQKLTSIEAPAIVVEKQKEYVQSLMNGELKIRGELDILAKPYKKAERKVGNGGKVYYVINDSYNFFPNAKYGMYIKRKDK